MREFTTGESEDGQRLDKFLKKLLPGAPLALIYKLSRTNRVKVDSKKRENDYRLTLGESVKIFLSEPELEEFGRITVAKPSFSVQGETIGKKTSIDKNPAGTPRESTKFRLSQDRILFEDDDVLAINKPAGLNVHPGDHKSDEISLIEAVSDYFGAKLDTLTFRPSLVHRIDRDTSGVILIAKTKTALDRLLSALQSDKMDKTYATIVTRKPGSPQGVIRKKLLRVENAKNEAKVRVDEAWLPSVTHYEIIRSDVAAKYCLLECRIETGRTHQIRVHLASIKCPVLWDRAYGDIPENSFAKRKYGIARQMLHARRLAFPHPRTGERIIVEAPFEPDMENLLRSSSTTG